MKITTNFIIKLSLSLALITLSTALSSSESKFLEVEGTASNFGGKTVEAVQAGLAKTKNNDIILTNDPRYKTPVLTERLQLREPIKGGQAETADEVPSDIDYYDGALGIKTSVSFCQQFITKPQACVNQGGCGWCLGEGSCVGGTKKGPISNGDCLRGKYVFEAPSADWNPVADVPNTRVSRTNVLGAQLTTYVQQP